MSSNTRWTASARIGGRFELELVDEFTRIRNLLELIAEWGVRTLETGLIKCSRAYIDKKDNIRIYLRGNSSHRLKTSGSNRIILPLDVCDELLKKSLIQQLSTKKTLNNDSFLIDASINESLQTLSRSLNKYIGRGQIYCLRHFFADQLFTPILRYLSKKLSGIFKQPIVNCLTSDSLCPG